MFERILADVHEHLTFQARTHLCDEIANYLNDDLYYPAKLEQSPKVKEEAETSEESQDVYKIWNSPLERTLSLLFKLYRCLEPGVFTGLAQSHKIRYDSRSCGSMLLVHSKS